MMLENERKQKMDGGRKGKESKHGLFQRESGSGKAAVCLGQDASPLTHTHLGLHTLPPYTGSVVRDSYVRLLSCHVTLEETDRGKYVTHLAAAEVMIKLSV